MEIDVAIFHCDAISLDAHLVRLEQRPAAIDVELPSVPWTAQNFLFHSVHELPRSRGQERASYLSLTQGSAPMWTRIPYGHEPVVDRDYPDVATLDGHDMAGERNSCSEPTRYRNPTPLLPTGSTHER